MHKTVVTHTSIGAPLLVSFFPVKYFSCKIRLWWVLLCEYYVNSLNSHVKRCIILMHFFLSYWEFCRADCWDYYRGYSTHCHDYNCCNNVHERKTIWRYVLCTTLFPIHIYYLTSYPLELIVYMTNSSLADLCSLVNLKKFWYRFTYIINYDKANLKSAN